MSKLKIHLQVGGYRIPLTIEYEDEKEKEINEEIFRKSEKQVNKYIDEYLKLYPRLSGEEILSLVSLRLATVIFKMEMNQDIEPAIEKIQNLDDELKLLLGDE